MESLTNKLTGARARRAAGTRSPHKNGEAMGAVGVRVERPVRLVTGANDFQSNRVEDFGALASQTIIMIQPMIGIKPTSCIHPLLSISCSRRVVTAMYGISVASENNRGSLSLMTLKEMLAMIVNRAHHQNSDLLALPVKSAYLEKQVLIESINVI